MVIGESDGLNRQDGDNGRMEFDGIARNRIRTLTVAIAILAGIGPLRAQSDASGPAPGVVFDAPGAPGVRMMAPIGERTPPAAPPRLTKIRIQGMQLPMPRAKPGSLSDAPIAPQTVSLPVPAPAASVTAAAPATPVIAAKIGPSQLANMKQAFTFANRGDWPRARGFTMLTGDPVFGTLMQWRYLLDMGSAAPFEEINSFLTAHGNWPRREALAAASERAMPGSMEPNQVIAWYANRTPITATGKIRLGEALIASDKREQGENLIRRAWIEGSFAPGEETGLLQRHGDKFTQADQRARLQQLLSREDGTAARRQLQRVDADAQRITNARLRIKASPALAASVMAGLPAALKSDPELRFDAARALRRRGMDREAWTLLAETPPHPTAADIADERWQERHIMTRDALRAGDYDMAYRLVSQHGMETGAGFADAEFLAGWIALRFLHKHDIALSHFKRLAGAVSLPISKARALYWQGRALEEAGQTGDAVTAYRGAAENHETFYGQLALARIEETPLISFPDDTATPPAQDRDAFNGDERIIAIRLLSEMGDRDRARLFAIRIANDTPNAWHLDMLAQLMTAVNDPAMSVRVAKIASYSGIVLPSRLAPMMTLPKFPGAGAPPDPALVLGLARQESEFDPKAVSSAGARGLMQIMPASARKAAVAHGLVYRLGDLVARPQYNMQIGMAIISDYLEYWGGSYILAIASYNGGAGNVTRWVETNGDPRDPTVDPIDWIERIPFGETRNYVQRVLENVQVYRSRLAGKQELDILADLYRPRAPNAAVLAFVPPEPAAPAPEPAAIPESASAPPPQTQESPAAATP
jgi:soluble lytic murein transglycosylase